MEKNKYLDGELEVKMYKTITKPTVKCEIRMYIKNNTEKMKTTKNYNIKEYGRENTIWSCKQWKC